MENLKELLANPIVTNALVSGLLLLTMLLLRWIAARSIRRIENLPGDTRRRWLVQVRNAAILGMLLGLVIIWAEELRFVAVSLLAVAVACVIATKELIQCLSGAALRSVSRAFRIGDRIEINGLRGDVIDHTALTTTILEIGPQQFTHQHTGRAIVIPNSVFLDKHVINESYTQDFVLHVIHIPLKLKEDWRTAEEVLLTVVQECCQPYLEQAREHFEKLAKKHEHLTTFSVVPKVTISITKPEELELVIRVPTPAHNKGSIEQDIVKRFLERRAETLELSSATDAKTNTRKKAEKHST